MAVLHKTKGAERAVIPVMFILFSLGGAVIALGYDSITGIFIAVFIGFK